MSPTIEYCHSTLMVYKHHAVYVDKDSKHHAIPERLMAIAVRRARRIGGILIRDAIQTNS